MKLAIPDLISNSYFPAIAAVELGLFAQQGLDVTLELMVPVDTAFQGMREGTVQFLGASAHLMATGFPRWRGVRLVCAQAQGMYWFLVTHVRHGLQPGDVAGLRDLRIGAAPLVAPGLRALLARLGHDPAANGLEIAPIPGAHGAGINFGVTAARALADGRIDGFWANGMGAALAVREGTGRVIIDARRDAVARPGFDFTLPVIACTEAFLQAHPGAAAAAARAVRAAHERLRADPREAARIGRKLFPPQEAELIVELVQRELPYYYSGLRQESLQAMLEFSRSVGLDAGTPELDELVAAEAVPEWESAPFRLPAPLNSCG